MGAVLTAPRESDKVKPISLPRQANWQSLTLFATIVAVMCTSLELEVLEQVDSLRQYMTVREILWDSSVALIMLLVMAVMWWACLLLIARLLESIPSLRSHARSLLWRLGLTVPLAYLAIELFKATRLLFFRHLHLGLYGSLMLGPVLLLICAIAVCRAQLPGLQHICHSRLAMVGWLHVAIAVLAIFALWASGVYVFRDFTNPATKAVASGLPDVYLISIDAMRADDLSLYGYARPTTPNLERFAQRASTFEFFFANSNFTTAATTSIETGKLPWTTRVFQLGGFLRGQAQKQNLAALLQKQGYYTAMISSNDVASPVQHRTMGSYDNVEYLLPECGLVAYYRYTNLIGLNTSYTLYGTLLKTLASLRSDLQGLLCHDRLPVRAEPVFDRARRLLQLTDNGQPHFVWMHVLPPHDPYLAPLPYRGRFLSSSKLNRLSDFIGFDNKFLPPHVSVAELRARYDENIAYADDVVGNFLDWLDQTGRLDRSVVIITADHGESFEHHWFQHTGPYLYNGLIRIPLLVHLPAQRQGSRITQPADQIDLLPTIMNLVGASVPSWSEGTSLVPALEGKAVPDRDLFSMNLERNSVFEPVTDGTVAVIDDQFKYIERLHTHDGELYRYKTDPLEQHDLKHSEPDVVTQMKALIANKVQEVNRQPIPQF